MTTIFAVIISAVLLLWPGEDKDYQVSSIKTQDKGQEIVSSVNLDRNHQGKDESQVLGGKAESIVHSESGISNEATEKINQQNVSEKEFDSKITDQNFIPISNKPNDIGDNAINGKEKTTHSDSNEKIHQLKNKPGIAEKQSNYTYPEQILDSTMFIELNQEELENLGFSLKDNNMQFQFFQGDVLVNISYLNNDISFGFFIDDYNKKRNDSSIINFNAERVLFAFDETKDECVVEDIYPMLITNKDGEKRLKISMPENWIKDLFSKKYNKDFRTLLPVVIRENTFDIQPMEDIVFWFLPTDNFFNLLPKYIREQLLEEYNYITAEDKSKLVKPVCKYFDECKNTFEDSNFKVYPNPANANVTVSFTLPEAITGRITLVDLAGRERQVLQSQTNYAKGQHSIQVDVSTVPEGIYLLTLYSDKGVQTQRLIVAR